MRKSSSSRTLCRPKSRCSSSYARVCGAGELACQADSLWHDKIQLVAGAGGIGCMAAAELGFQHNKLSLAP